MLCRFRNLENRLVKHVFIYCMCVCVLRRVFRHSVCEGGQVHNILVVKPLDLEVQVHVVCSLTELVLLVFCKNDNHAHKETH